MDSFSTHTPQLNSFIGISEVGPRHKYEFPGLIGGEHNFHSCWIKGVLTSGVECEHQFVFFRDTKQKVLSFITVANTRYQSVKVRGLGTFEYTDGWWNLTRKKKPTWSILPCSVSIADGPDLFDAENILFMTEFFNRDDFRTDFEQYVFQQYQTVDYPEYLAYDEEEQSDYDYPSISSKEEVWQLLGKTLSMHAQMSEKTMTMNADYLADDEHGITITIKYGKIELGSNF